MRCTREPALVVLDVEQLDDHTNADDQSVYRDAAEILQAQRDSDPIVALAEHLARLGVSAVQVRIRCSHPLLTYSGLPSTMSTGYDYVNLTLNRYSGARTFIPLRPRLVEGVLQAQPMVYPNQLTPEPVRGR